MTRASPALRMVLDSSVAIFEVLKPNRLCYEWERGVFIPLISERTARELNRKLTQLAPKAAITDGQRVALEGRYLAHCERVVIPEPPPLAPKDTPPEDVPFVELAIAASADALVSKDGGLLRLNKLIVGKRGLIIPVLNYQGAVQKCSGAG